jgi:glutamate-1-semialdehyde 2,1-aminomutase
MAPVTSPAIDRRALQKAYEGEVAAVTGRNPRSAEMFRRAAASLPGGNTRTGVHMHPFPLYADRGEGTYLIDVDGHRLLDFVNNNTALILGHAHPAVVTALQQVVSRGTGFSRPTALEVEVAELVRQRLPSLQRLRFCSSGSEAVVNALRTARAFTGRMRTAKFEGAFHGIDDHAMVSYLPAVGPQLGAADRPVGVASARGLSSAALEDVVVLPFNDADACEALIAEHSGELAAVIVDPLSTAAGLSLPVDGFLQRLAEATRRAGALLVFDEIVSFRMGPGGAQEHFGVHPDLTCLGKVIAGGTPGAVFGGREEVMALYDPRQGPPAIPQSGTFNANPFALAAGKVTLETMTEAAYERLGSLAQTAAQGLQQAIEAADLEGCVVTAGSMFRVYFLPAPPRDYRQAAADDGLLQRWLHLRLLNQGIYWRLGGSIALPHERAQVAQLVTAVGDSLASLPKE